MTAMSSRDIHAIRAIQTLKNEYTQKFLTEERRQYDIAIQELRKQREAKRRAIVKEVTPPSSNDILDIMESLNCDDYIMIQDKPINLGKSNSHSTMDVRTMYY